MQSSSSKGIAWMTWLRRLAVLATPLALIGMWQLAVHLEWLPVFLLPPPGDVAERFVDVLSDGDAFLIDSTLWKHSRATLEQVLAGLVIGLGVGVMLGYLIARVPVLEALISPVIVAFQATPVVAYAPLLVIWFGAGPESKIVTTTLIVFFPMLMNTVVGVRGVPQDLRDLMRVHRANWWQTFTRLELPAAMPVLMTGVKTSATLAVIGSVVGEFVAADVGLGFLLNDASFRYDTALRYVAAITLSLMAGSLYLAASMIERHLLRWQRPSA